MARRRRAQTDVPVDVVRHSPVSFDDAYDLPDEPSGVTPPWRDSPSVVSGPFPLLPRRPGVYLKRSSVAGVWGSMPQAEPVFRKARLPVSAVVRLHRRHLLAKQAASEKRRFLFNVLVSPFSRRARHCVKRKVRREVLFALRRRDVINQRSPGGAGGYRRTPSSQWRC